MSKFTPSKHNGYRADGTRAYFFGGGGGGGSDNYYENQDRLLGVQADIAEGIYNNIYQPHAPGAVAGLSKMVTEANDGTLATQMREQAGADANVALGTSASDALRTLSARGGSFDPTTGRGADIAAKWGIDAAKVRTGAMTGASRAADQQKWGRSYDFYNALSGVPSQASASAGSAAAGYGQMAGRESEIDAANARGYGQAGGMAGRALFAKDGGLIRRQPGGHAAVARGGIKMANGGLMRLPPWRSRPSNAQGPQAASPMESFSGSAAMGAGSELLKGAAKPYLDPIKAGIKGMFSTEPASIIANPLATDAVAASVADTGAGIAASELAPLGTEALAAAGTEAAAATTATAAAEAAAATTATAAAEAAPMLLSNPVTAALGGLALLAGMDGMFADGGRVPGNGARMAARGIERKDMTGGGKVKGPGGPTDDKVAAWLSPGEFVVNAKAVDMVGADKLDAINDAGLRRRQAQPLHIEEGKVKAAGGGMFGVALGAGVEEINRQRQADRLDRFDQRADEQLGIVKQNAAQEQALRGIQLRKLQRDESDTDQIRSGAVAGLKNTNDLRDDEKMFAMSKGMYEQAIRLNRPDLATSYYGQMLQNRDALLAHANDRADRVFRSTGNISGYVDAYNRYVADGNTIDAFKRNADGSHSLAVNDGSGVSREITVPKEQINEYLLALRDPGKISSIEAERSNALFKAQTEAQAALNKPMAVGKDQTLVVPSTGQTFAPRRGGDFDVKEAGPVLDDARKMLLERSGNFDQSTGKWNWSPDAVAKAGVAERLFIKNSSLTPAMLAEIADKGTTGTAVVEIGGKQQRVQAVSHNGRTYLLGGGDAGMPTTVQPPASPAPAVPAGTTGIGTRSVGGKIAPGLQRVQPQSSPGFPKVSQSDQFARDAEAGKILVSEAGGVSQAQQELAQMDAALKNPRLDGTQRGILQSHRNRMAAGIAAMSPQG